ncbi:MAG: TonB-dependent receptor [Bacteroidales bacterium]
MKLFTLLMCISIVSMASVSYSQNTKFTMQHDNITLGEVFEEIEKSSKFIFIYSERNVDLQDKVSVSVKNEDVSKILNQVFKGKDNYYEIKDRQILIKSKKEETTETESTPVSVFTGSQQEQSKVKGKVLDENGELVVGATVSIKGTTNATITNVDGEFETKAVIGQTLVVSFIGYDTQEILLEDLTYKEVSLGEDVASLEGVVVTAFGTAQKKESVVGSIESIHPDELIVPATSLSNAFAGRLSGVIAYQRSGQPGADGSSFYIRGISTISGATNPLVIIDGVEASNATLNALPPEVIESFSILKDATATAMYGTRGANGVMIVTTKSGANMAKPAINVRVENTFSNPTSIPEFVSGAQYMRLYNEAVTNQSTGDALYTNEEITGTEQGLNPYIFPNVDWYNEIFKSQSKSQNVNFNVRGGGKKTDYFMNVGYIHQDGMLRSRSKDYFSYDNNFNLNRFVFQNNINLNLTESSKISLRLNTQLQTLRSPQIGTNAMFSSTMNTSPVLFPTMYPDDGNTDWIKWGGSAEGNAITNPLAELTKGYEDQFTSNVTANLEYTQKLNFVTKGLSFKALASFMNASTSTTTRSQGYNSYRISSYAQDANGEYNYTIEPLGSEDEPVLSTSGTNIGNRRIYLQAYFDYNRRFNLHEISGMALYNQDELSNNIATTLLTSLPRRKQGLAFRATYGYDNRYMFEFNLGYNGSENFAEGHRWGLFPSVAIGYNLSREKFFEPLTNVISNLKLRASYGLVGNDQIGSDRFIYLSDIDLTGSDAYKTGYGSTSLSLSGPVYTRYRNEDITWEVGRKLNIGFDLQLFRDLNFVLDFFREDRDNIFQTKNTVPNYLGTAETTIYGNFAAVRNQGFDMSVDYGKVINDNWTIQFKGTFTYAHNEVTAYDEALFMEYPQLRMVGSYLNRITGYVSDNLFIDWNQINNSADQQISGNVAPGDIKYIDQPDANGNYDGIINSNDRVTMGYPSIPEIVYGFGPSAKYKNLDFSVFFQGVARVSLMMSGFHPFGTQNSHNVMQFIADDYWSEDNQNIYASYPRITKTSHSNNTVASDFWLRDARFLKLKNAEVGYTHKQWRFYVSGMNLLTFSPFKYWDPEMGGGSGLKYPTQSSFSIGLQLNL